MNSINVVFIKTMQQYEDCGVSELYIKLDSVMSHVSDVCAMGVNLAIMIGTGWADKNTAPFIFYDLMAEGWALKSFLLMGKAI